MQIAEFHDRPEFAAPKEEDSTQAGSTPAIYCVGVIATCALVQDMLTHHLGLTQLILTSVALCDGECLQKLLTGCKR